tara:strand:- start:503 stop:949 length:447 start_codon:yes stop_codon:yes gene_type:complete
MKPSKRYSFMPISDLMGYGHPSSVILHKKENVPQDDFPLFIEGINHIIHKWAEQVSNVTGAEVMIIIKDNIEPFYCLADVYDELLIQDDESVFDLRKKALAYLSECKGVLDKLEMSYKRPQMLKDFYNNLGERLKESVICLMEGEECL